MISSDGKVCFSISKIEHSDVEQQLGVTRLVMMDDVVMGELTMGELTMGELTTGAIIGHRGHLRLESLKKGEKMSKNNKK